MLSSARRGPIEDHSSATSKNHLTQGCEGITSVSNPGGYWVAIDTSIAPRGTLELESHHQLQAIYIMPIDMRVTGIACGGIGFKGVFVHGVLSVFEAHGFRAAAYAGASMAVLPAVRAAAGVASSDGIEPWLRALEMLKLPDNGMSDVVIADITAIRSVIAKTRLFSADAPRLCIATSAVHTLAGAVETQGPRAGALGRRLIVHASREDRTWASENLTAHIWDTAATDRAHRLTSNNVEEAIYASTRLLNGWNIPAEVDGIPYVDAAYTCSCPALELSALEYREVIAIASDTGPVYRDMFHTSVIPEMAWRSRIRTIRPTIMPKAIGVEETSATEKGLVALYDHGLDQGLRFITEHLEARPEPAPGWNWPKREE
jgi:predicted acylesterase/phospholipase RssA